MKIRKILALSLSLVMVLAMSAMFISSGSADVHAAETPATDASYYFNPDKVDSQFKMYVAETARSFFLYNEENKIELTYVSGTGFKNGSETVASTVTNSTGTKQFKANVSSSDGTVDGTGNTVAVKFRAPKKGLYVFSVNAYGTGNTAPFEISILTADHTFVEADWELKSPWQYATGSTQLGENQDAWIIIRATAQNSSVPVQFNIEAHHYCAEVVGMVGRTDDTLNPAANSGFRLLSGGEYGHGTVFSTAQAATQVTNVPEEDPTAPFYTKTGQLIASPKADRTVFVEFTAPTDGLYTYIYEANSWSSPGTTRTGVITNAVTGNTVGGSSVFLSFEGVMNDKNTTHPNVKGDSGAVVNPVRKVQLSAGDKIYFFASNDGAGANITVKITMFRIEHDEHMYLKDETGHVEVCGRCEQAYADKASHSFDNDGNCVCGWETCKHDNMTDGKCDDCGYECQHTNTSTKKNDTQHWTQCDDCGTVVGNKVAHEYTGADCKTAGTCECGQTGAKNPSVHNGTTTTLAKNNNGTHTEKYDCCGAEVKTENCTYDKTTYKCACGNECPHTAYENGKCKTCQYAHTNHTGGEATCNSKAVCETCGIEYGTFNANNHNNDNKTIFEQVAGTDTHKQKCSACNVVYGDAVACAGGTATCSAKATCTKCGKEYGEVDANNHDVTGVKFVSLGDGTHAKKCKLCQSNVGTTACNDGKNGDTADCMNKAVCVTCNTAYGEVNSTKHVCGETPVWEKVDEQTHANKWACGVVVKTENHNDDKAEATCNAKAQCSVCGSEWGDYNEANHVDAEVTYTSNNDGTHVATWECCDTVDTTDVNCDGTATCVTKAKCSKCGGEYGEVDPDNHAGNCVVVLDETLTDDYDHYFVYSECGAAANDGAHDYDVTGLCECGYACTHSEDNDDDGFCDACGANVDHVHDWSNGVCQDALCGVECPHTAYNGYNNGVDSYKCKVCDVVCDHSGDNGDSKATCIEKATCSVCKQTYGDFDADNHASAEFDCIDNEDGTHKVVKLCCGATVVESEAHTFGDDSVCDDCGFTCTEHDYLDGTCVICAQDHAKHTGATCTNGGTCTVCQKVYTTVEHTNRSNATCTAKAVCVYCGEYGEYDYTKHTSDKVKYDVTEDAHTELHACCGTATGKAAEAHKGGKATCKELATCEVCGEKYGDFSGHTGGAATCTEKAVCTVCGEAYGEDTDGHTGGKATCCKKAVCTVCGEEYGEVDATNHEKGVKWTITADKHSSKYECCGAVATAEAAHTGGKATCEEKAKCSVCGASYGELDPTNHASKTYTWKKDSKVHSATYDCCGAVAVAEEAHDPKNCDKCGGYSAPTSDVAISIAAAIAVTGIIGFAVATKKRKH